jgi:hypothetical protein
MDPCPFGRLIVRNLALKIPVASKPARSVVHPSSSLCFCKPPLFRSFLRRASSRTATFHLSKSDVERLSGKYIFAGKLSVKISIYAGRRGTTCGVSSGKLIGKVSVQKP